MPRRQRTVLFRVDASASIGTGHLVRCLALAGELARRGIEPSFASREDIAADGFRVVRLAQGSDEHATLQAHPRSGRRRRPFDFLALDHYGLGAEWLDGARNLAAKRAAVDDLADRRLPCELLINPGIGVESGDYAGLVAPATRLLLGPRFALLRQPFRATRERQRRSANTVKTVLVTMGGGDPRSVTAIVVEAVQAALPEARIDVVLGALYRGPQIGGPRVHVHRAIGEEEMARLMVGADMAIGAGGSTSWERCALGLPSIIVRLAPNQDAVAWRLDAAGIAVDGGSADDLSIGELAGRIGQLASDIEGRQRMSDRARKLVDGRGTERVAHHLEGVRMRVATFADARRLWGWANDPVVRAASFHSEPIEYPSHVRWLRERLADPTSQLLIGWNGAGPLGQVRFDTRGGAAEVSISVAAEHRGTVGGLLLESAIRRFRRGSPHATIEARVKHDNEPSRRLFERAGFSLAADQGGVLLYHAPASSGPESGSNGGER